MYGKCGTNNKSYFTTVPLVPRLVPHYRIFRRPFKKGFGNPWPKNGFKSKSKIQPEKRILNPLQNPGFWIVILDFGFENRNPTHV